MSCSATGLLVQAPSLLNPGHIIPMSGTSNIILKNPENFLEEAGWKKGESGMLEKDGKAFEFTVLVNQGNDARLKTAQIIKENLKKIGIKMNIKVLEWQAMLHEFIDKKRFEAIIMGWGLSRDPDMYDIWHSSKTKEGEFNFISFKNEEVDRLLLEGRRTFDFEKRKKIYHRIHEILSDEQPYTFLYVPDALPVLHKRFKGVEKAPIGIWYDFIHWHVPKNRIEWYQLNADNTGRASCKEIRQYNRCQ